MFLFRTASRGPLLTCLLAAWLMPVAASTRSDPLDPAAPTRALPHRSVWRDAAPLPMPEVDPVDWRAAHEAVRRAGGWRALAREVAPPLPRERTREVAP